MGIDVHVGDLAQRALADAFDQLIRIGTAGANSCFRYAHLPYQPAERLDSQTARDLIASAHEALHYAEQQLQYLDRRDPPGSSAPHGTDGDGTVDDDDAADRASLAIAGVSTRGHLAFGGAP